MASANDNSEVVEPEVNNDNQIKPDTKPTEQQQQQDDATESNQLEAKIIRQMEYYFGDRNLLKDKFLQEKIKENDEGWVTLDVLLTFNRLKTLSTDTGIISGAIKKSNSGLLEVSDDCTSIRRTKGKEDLPTVQLLAPEERKSMRERTIHIKGFPEDSTFDDIQDFLLQFGQTVYIQMRRYTADHVEKPRIFKGSVFAEYNELDAVTKILDQSDDFKYKDIQLLLETKDQYLERQKLKNKKRKDHGSTDDSTAEEPKAKVSKVDDDDANVVRKTEAVLSFKGCGSDTKRENIKELFNQWSEVAWVDFKMGDTEGFVRFDENGGAKKVYEAMTKDGSTPQICDSDTELKVLQGDEEVEYWKNMQLQRRQEKGRRGRGRGRGGRRGGGYGGGRFKKRSRDD